MTRNIESSQRSKLTFYVRRPDNDDDDDDDSFDEWEEHF